MSFPVRRLAFLSALSIIVPAIAAAQCPSGGVTYTGGSGIAPLSSSFTNNVVITPASPYPSNLTIPSSATGTITSLCLTLNGLNATSSSTGVSTQGLAIALKSPSGRILGLVGNTGDGNETLSNVTLNISDSASTYMPDGTQGQAWPNNNGVTTGTLTDKPSSYANGFSDTVFPSLGTLNSNQLPLDTTDNQGSKTLSGSTNGEFYGDGPAGTWSLYVVDSSGFSGDNISFASWSLTITVSQSNISTSTMLSANNNPSLTSSGVTLTANVTSNNGTPTGTVSFADGGSVIPGCGGVALSNGFATCNTSFSSEGTHQLTASYTPSGSGFTASSTVSPLNEYVRRRSTSPSAGLYCNSGLVNAVGNVNGTGTIPYPSVINVGTDTPALSSSVATVSVVFNGLSASGAQGVGPVHALLVSPDGNHSLEFMSGAGDNISQPSVNVTWADGGATPPNYFSSSPLTSGTYHPFSEDTTDVFPPTVGGAVPSLPNSYNLAAPGGGSTALDFAQAFNGASSDGNWLLFLIDTGGNNTGAQLASGWCIQITQASGTPTSTSVSGSPNPAVGVPAVISATVRNANTQAPVTEGTVTFTENGNPVSGGPSGPVPVNTSGVASFSATLPQGDHTITATYSDGGGTFNLSFGSLVQRADNATPAPSIAGNVYSYCNPGAIQIPGLNNPTDQGPGYPNPSNIFVTGLPGQTSAVTLSLNNFSHLDPQLVTSLVVGPGAQTANTLDFFSGAGGEPGTANPLNLTFSDAASSYAPTSPLAPGTYTFKPTSYNGNDHFTGSASGFYSVPPQIQYAGPIGASTLNGTFAQPNASNNGTWSLFFNQTAGSLGGSVGGGWCVNFTQTPPVLAIAKSAVTTGSMAQGQTGFSYNLTVSNSGPGSTGGTVSVTDTPSSGLSLVSLSGSGWTCSGSTCTRSDALASGSSYPVIVASVNVASNAASPQTNYATVSGGGSAAGVQSNTVSTTVLASTSIAAANVTTTFSSASQTVTLSATVTSASGPVNGGTVSFAVLGIAGAASVSSGQVANGAASALFTIPAGTSVGTYQISATYIPSAAYSGSSDSTHSLTIQAPVVPATVTSLTSTLAHGTYGPNTVIPIQVNFSKAVTVTGTPLLSLNDAATAAYSSGSGTATLTFTYTVASGQNTPRLDATSLTTNGGAIMDLSGTAATLTLPAAGAPGSLGVNDPIAIDTTSPQVVSYSVNFGSNGSYNLVGATRTAHLPWTITSLSVTFSAPIATANKASLSGITATALSGLGTSTLTWTFAPISNATLATALAGSGPNAIQDAYGNNLGAGTNFAQSFSVLYGDFNGDGSVTAADMTGVANASRLAYNPFADINGDGLVNTSDTLLVKQQQGATQH